MKRRNDPVSKYDQDAKRWVKPCVLPVSMNIAVATGTGKSRAAVAIMERLLRPVGEAR